MEELLPYYERELSHLRQYSEDFAQRYPKIAGHLLPADEHSDDPQIEQLVQAIALLDARIGKKLKDDYPQCVEALLDVMHPHYLRPFPACSIAQFAVAAAADGEPYSYRLARGTELVSRSINGVQCRFKTVYDVTLAPLAISEARYMPTAVAPVVLPLKAAGIVSITFESTAPHLDLRSLGLRTVRTHLNGESSFIAALADGHRDWEEGEWQTSRRIEAIEAIARQWEATGNNRFVMPGRWFQLTDHFGHSISVSYFDDEYLITFAHHVATNNYLQGVGAQATYSNRFTCVKKTTPWRPMRGFNSVDTRILAPQTAVVVGPEGESLYTDEYGRVLLQFHWDREGKYTTWVRVSSGWAGGAQGMSALPRIGSEVVVQWIDGNPDHPLVTGRVGSAMNLPAWRLPHQRALTGIRSRELVGDTGNRGGGRSNHLVFDDTANAIQTQLRSDHQASQLSLGSITRIEDWQGRQDARGEGFELRTDAVGAIRSGKGMLVSTEARRSAQSHIADVSEPVSRLAQAQEQHDQLGKLAQQHRAQDGGSDQSNVANALQAQVDGIRGRTGRSGDRSFPELNEPHLLLAAASGLQATTPETIHVNGGEHIALTAGRDVSVGAGKSLPASVLDKISLFAQNAGMKLFAAKGKVEIQAHSDNIELTAQKTVKVTSTMESIEVASAKGILLTSGGAYIRISNGNIEVHAPGTINIKGAQHSFAGPTRGNYPLPDLPQATRTLYSQKPSFRGIDDGSSMEGVNYTLFTVPSDGEAARLVASGASSSDGAERKLNEENPDELRLLFGQGEWGTYYDLNIDRSEADTVDTGVADGDGAI